MVKIYGAGALSCGSYVQAYDAYRPFIGYNGDDITAWSATLRYMQNNAWIEGYLFGVDLRNQENLRDFDEAGMQLWIYQFCQQHPLDVVVNAAFAFYKKVGGNIPSNRSQRLHSPQSLVPH